MQTKSEFVLFVIVVLMVISIIIGCIYGKEQYKITIQQQKEQLKEQIHKKRTIEIETYEEVDTNQAVQPVSLGEFKLTAYCPCKKCCGKWAYNRPDGVVYGAIGEELKEGYSIAVDPDIIPYKTEVIINGKIYKKILPKF